MQGLRVAVTGGPDGRGLCEALQRHGATVTWGPTLATVPPKRDTQLLAETDAVLSGEPEWMLASTGGGMAAWMDAACAHGRGERLTALLTATPLAARPSAAAGLRRLGVSPLLVFSREGDAELIAWLSPQLRTGQVVAAQVHGADEGQAYRGLQEVGVTLLRVKPHRWVLPEDREPARRLVLAVVGGAIDVIICTSGLAVRNLFRIGAELGCEEGLLAALREQTAVAALGPMTAQAFWGAGIPVAVTTARSQRADLIGPLCGWVGERRERRGEGCGEGRDLRDGSAGPIELLADGRVVRVGARAVVLGEREFAVLAALMRRPGVVCRQEVLAREAWGPGSPQDPGQVKHYISRIRRKLGVAAWTVQTVRRVGYRYSTERPHDTLDGAGAETCAGTRWIARQPS